jgi:hypothetical protein
MRAQILICFMVFLPIVMAACSPTQAPIPTPTSTTLPPTPSATATEVWFPPTPTYTPFATQTREITPVAAVEPIYGDLIFQDNFSNSENWTLNKSSLGSIALGVNELTIAIKEPRGYLYSLRKEPSLKDYYLEITASPSICRAEDEYGLLLRVTKSFDFYRFSLTCSGQTRVDKYYRGVASSPQALIYSSEVPPGAPSTSRLGVWINANVFHFYINNIYQFSIQDPSITEGALGVFARASGDEPVTINFSDLVVYEVSR